MWFHIFEVVWWVFISHLHASTGKRCQAWDNWCSTITNSQWNHKRAVLQPCLSLSITVVTNIEVTCFWSCRIKQGIIVFESYLGCCRIIWIIITHESLSVFTWCCFEDIKISWWVLIVWTPNNTIWNIPIFCCCVGCIKCCILHIIRWQLVNVDHHIVTSQWFFNGLFQRLGLRNIKFRALVNWKVQMNWKLNTICLESILSFGKLSLSFFCIVEAILTISKIHAWPFIPIWRHFLCNKISEGLITCTNEVRRNKEISNSFSWSILTIDLWLIYRTVNSKVNWLTEVFIQKSFFRWRLFSVSLFSSVFVTLTVNINTNSWCRRTCCCVINIVFIFLLYRSIVWTRWEDTSNIISAISETTFLSLLIRTIIIRQFDSIKVNIFLVPIIFILSQLNWRFSCQRFEKERSIIKDRGWVCWFTKIFSFILEEVSIYWEKQTIGCLRVPVWFWFLKRVLQSIVINCLDTHIREIFIGTREIVRQSSNRILYQIKSPSFGIRSMLKTSYKVLGSHISILFTIWSIPFNTLTDFISISQTILRDRPIFSYWRNKVPIFISFHKTIYSVSYSSCRRSSIWCNIIQGFWIRTVNITISSSASVWFRWTSR